MKLRDIEIDYKNKLYNVPEDYCAGKHSDDVECCCTEQQIIDDFINELDEPTIEFMNIDY